jgi:hypothetical protein
LTGSSGLTGLIPSEWALTLINTPEGNDPVNPVNPVNKYNAMHDGRIFYGE